MRGSTNAGSAPIDNHPVGSLYWSRTETSPASLFGGIWEQIKDRFILAAGDTYAVGATGGAATHTLSISEMPSHSHRLPINYGSGDGSYRGIKEWSDSCKQDAQFHTNDVGYGAAHNNMPPYDTFYCWERIA